MLAIDSTTRTAYDAASGASNKAQVVVDALGATVAVKIYDGGGNEKASGTMGSPWATQTNGVISIGEVTSMAITAAGTPDANWYLRFEGNSRWLRGSFGLRSSAQDFVARGDAWVNGFTITLGTVQINAPSNTAPSIVGAPSTLSFLYGTGGTHDFSDYVSDPEGGPHVYALIGTAYNGITIDPSSGVLTVTAAAAAATRNLTIRVTDPTGLSTDWPCAVKISAALYRWHPGHGLKIKDDTGTSTVLSEQLSQINNYLNDSAYLTWVHYRPRWGRLNTTGSTYDWSPLESILAAAGTKRVVIDISYKGFGAVDDYIAPLDLMGELIATGSGWIMPVWRPAIMDRFITYVQTMGGVYDTHSRIEGLVMCESASSLQPPFPADFSRPALATQLKRLYSAARNAWPHTAVFANLNSLSGELVGLLEHAHAEGLGFSTPDAVDTNGVRLFRGETVASEGSPDMDHRGVMPHLEVASAPVLGGKDNNGPPSNVINWSQTNAVTHLSWYSGGTQTYDWASILSAINADPLLSTACPSIYGGACSSD